MVILLLGSNLGDRLSNLNEAYNKISESTREILISSSIYETEPWGFQHKNLFLNQVLVVNTDLSPESLLHLLFNIEKELGRKRRQKSFQARIIDIDILFYDDLIISTNELEIPHPKLHERRFVLEPLNEILPYLIHPVLLKSVARLLKESKDPLLVRKFLEKKL